MSDADPAAGTDPRTTTPAAGDPPAPEAQGDGTPAAAAATGTTPGGGASSAAAGKPPARVRMTWRGERRFDVGRPDGPVVRADGNGGTGPTPVDLLVGALASCVSVDVVDILAKRRTPVESLTVDAVAERANAVPARLTAVDLTVRITGAGIERVHAERAIELAVTKYCSVRDSLDPALPVRWTLELR